MQCPKCNTDNTQRLEVIYEDGTQNIRTTSRSVGAGMGGSFGAGGVKTSTSGISQSKSARKAAPPSKKSYIFAVITAIVGLLFLGGDIGAKLFGVLLIATGGYFIYSAIQYNSQKWPDLYQYWKDSWMCNKCGTIYHQP